MTVFDLFDSIGNVDDEFIEKAKQPKKSRRKLIVSLGSLAACIIACTSIIISRDIQKGNGFQTDVSEEQWTGSASSEDSVNKEFGEIVLEEIHVEVYYVLNGRIECQTVITAAKPEKLFEIWKSKNHIGEEVKLMSVQLTDNGSTEVSEYSGVEVVTHKAGTHTIYTLTITKNLEQYYDDIDKDLLLESLEKTMTGMYDPKPDEYKLILSDSGEDEECESNRIVSDDNRYNAQGEILE